MTAKKLLRYFVAIAVMLLPFSLIAAGSATEKLNIFVQTVVTFKANFKQMVLDPDGKLMEEAEGKFALERPGKFRWDYSQPYPQHIVADGERIWFYDVDLEQVTVKSQLEALVDTPATLLSGESMPEDKYILTDIPSEDGMLWVELVPKDVESNFQTVTLAFDQQGLRQMIMRDSFDQRTRLVFSQQEENTVLADDEFVFIPPEGIDVVGETGL
ncbi:MAG: outer membrane lipoprotein carrier protein LolA [Gammaproteobacteria bacterium]|nr:MAG: outer membrane lipoprotein carrier protein LolA [Gammaproteobacteria bacterium]RKZ96475.1 MAG: outer membrane lipoprotein carrier protein LolA [Gammaproteobacteria bacterium]